MIHKFYWFYYNFNKHTITFSLNFVKMNPDEAFMIWGEVAKRMKDPTFPEHYFAERLVNELSLFTSIKGLLYDLAFKKDEETLSVEEQDQAEEHVKEINKILSNLLKFVDGGKERNYSFKNLVIQEKFVKNYSKGYYDSDFADLCNFTSTKIVRGLS